MIHDFDFKVPGQPPSVNRMYDNAYAFDGSGKRYMSRKKSHEVEQYQLVAMNACQRAKPALWMPPEPYQPKLGRGLIVIELYFHLARDIDCDNAQKALLDAIKFGLGTTTQHFKRSGPKVVPIYDDNRFLGRAMWKQTGVKEPHVYVRIGPLP